MLDAVAEIRRFNQGRESERLAIKLAKMKADAFTFFRGACHLFYANRPTGSVIDDSPVGVICGDLHVENFGSYRDAQDDAAFDVADFDESAHAPIGWDLVRLLASLRLAMTCRASPANEKRCSRLEAICLSAYRSALAEARPGRLAASSAAAPIAELLDQVDRSKRKKFVEKRTEIVGDVRRLREDPDKALPLGDGDRAEVEDLLARASAAVAPHRPFHCLDAKRRVSGTGSLGLGRYVALVSADKDDDPGRLLDVKESVRSAAAASWPGLQPRWESEAQRIAETQRGLQAVPPRWVVPVAGRHGRTWLVRELQPKEDHVELASAAAAADALVADFGRLAAWAHLRGSGVRGAAKAGVLAGWLREEGWDRAVRDEARRQADLAVDEHKAFASS